MRVKGLRFRRGLIPVKAAGRPVGHNRGMKLRCSLVLVLLLALAGSPAGRARATEQVFPVQGVIRAPLDGDQLVIAHEDIPGFMPAMTMAFTVARPAEAAALRVGDRVRFQLRVSENDSRAEGIQRLGQGGAVAASPAPAARTARLREGDTVPDFSLVNEDGAPLTAEALRGRFTVMTFIFSRCPVPEYCPAMALRFGELQRRLLADPRLAARVRLLSVSFDPEFDRPATLKAYGAAIGANPAIWNFATGRQEQIDALTKAFAVFVEREGVMLNHTLCTALIGPEGRIVALWRGNGWRADDVLEAIARQASQER
jgi:protein SCO1/2